MLHRAFCVTDGKAPLEITPFAKSKTCPQINFVFTGQGAQWAGMANELLEDFPEFRDNIKAMDKVLAKLPGPPSWTIEGASIGSLTFNQSLMRRHRRVAETGRD